MSVPMRHYVIVRGDLPHGAQLAQVVHAAGESTFGLNVPNDTFAVCLRAKREKDLVALLDVLRGKVAHVAIRETDGQWAGQLMAVGIRPDQGELAKPLLKDFQVAL